MDIKIARGVKQHLSNGNGIRVSPASEREHADLPDDVLPRPRGPLGLQKLVELQPHGLNTLHHSAQVIQPQQHSGVARVGGGGGGAVAAWLLYGRGVTHENSAPPPPARQNLSILIALTAQRSSNTCVAVINVLTHMM